MPAPVYAILGDADRDESQEAINLNIVDSSGKHVDLGGGQADPAGEAPTKAEFIALRDALVAAGQMASA